MTNPAAFESASAAAASIPLDLALPAPRPVEETLASFEELLQEESADLGADEPDEEAPGDVPFAAVLEAPPVLFLPPLCTARELGKVAVGEKNLPIQNVARATGEEQIAVQGPLLQEKADGMAAAQGVPMVFTESKNDQATAAADPQVALDIECVAAPTEPKVNIGLHSPRPGREKVEGQTQDFHNVAHPPRAEEMTADGVDAPEPLRPVLVRSVEEIGGHVQLLRTTGHDRLEVVVRPDGRTELHLQISRTEGLIHVQVRCDRGDYGALEAQWSTVQSALAAQGIRLENLQPGHSGGAGTNTRQGSANQQEQHRDSAEFYFEQDQTPQAQTSSPAGPHAWAGWGWQRWA